MVHDAIGHQFSPRHTSEGQMFDVLHLGIALIAAISSAGIALPFRNRLSSDFGASQSDVRFTQRGNHFGQAADLAKLSDDIFGRLNVRKTTSP
jgi:hypothetical protein